MMNPNGPKSQIDSWMESLQAELMMDIFSRVPILDLPKLRYVCKRWYNILKDPLFGRLYENRVIMLKRSSELYLVDLADKMNPRQVAIDLPPVPNFSDYKFVGSCNGLLCLGSTKCRSVLVINPFTRQHLLFSMHLNINREIVWSWGFGFDDTTKLFKVIIVFFNKSNFDNLLVRVCDLGSGKSTNWRNIGVTTFRTGLRPPCSVNGRLHWTYDSCRIISFDLAKEEFRPIPLPDCLCNETDFDFDLIVLGGCLCIFHFQARDTMELEIWVMREYGIKASWVKEFNTQPLIPKSLSSFINMHRGWRSFQGLGSLKNGELIVSEYDMQTCEEATFISSDSTCTEFKNLQLEKPPSPKASIIHTGSLNWI